MTDYTTSTEIFQSPVSGKPLMRRGHGSLVDEDGNVFKRHEQFGYWNFVPSQRSPIYNETQWKAFQKLIQNFLVSYENHPEVNVSYDARQDALDFGSFCKFNGLVLDIGCGPHKIPSYIKFRKNRDATYFGVDVLSGEHPKELNFVQAMGEHLPFKDNTFDTTVSGTSLLHYVDIKQGICEGLRVTKPSGQFCIWLGVKSKDAPPVKNSAPWFTKLQTPEGAENPFHYKRWSAGEFEQIFLDVGAELIEKENHWIDDWRENVFFRIKKK